MTYSFLWIKTKFHKNLEFRDKMRNIWRLEPPEFCFRPLVFLLEPPGKDGEGNGNPLQCSCLENPRDGGAWWAAVYGVAQSRA